MKKIVSLLLVCAMVFALCACSSKEIEEAAVEAGVPEEVVEEVMPTVEELAAQAAELYYSGNYSEVFSALTELKDSGVDFVTELLGACHYYGLGTEIDAEEALSILEDVAQQGSAAAQLIIAEATAAGNGTIRDPEKAEELYAKFVETAENLGVDASQAGTVFAKLADCYAKGIGTEIDLEKAKQAVEDAIANGNLSVFDKFELAQLIGEIEKLELNTEDVVKAAEAAAVELQQNEQAVALYNEAKEGIELLAENGNIMALKLIGDYYYGALGSTEQDYAKAMEYYTKAADLGNGDAMAQLGLMYQNGEGVEQNYEMAMEWNNRGALQGNAQAQAQIGYMYHTGLGVTRNLNEAGRWYTKAADQGNAWAAEKLIETERTNPQSAFQAIA